MFDDIFHRLTGGAMEFISAMEAGVCSCPATRALDYKDMFDWLKTNRKWCYTAEAPCLAMGGHAKCTLVPLLAHCSRSPGPFGLQSNVTVSVSASGPNKNQRKCQSVITMDRST